MLKIENFIREFLVMTKTDRDVEIPLLLEFLRKIQPIESLLDIGAHHTNEPTSYAYYATEVRKSVRLYDGIDILDDPKTREIVDNYFIGNANIYKLTQYDVIICVSTIEHAGLSTYRADYKKERNALFSRCLELAKKYIWISFPVGQEYVYPDQLGIIDEKQLKHWETIINNPSIYKLKERFFYTQGAQAGHPWYEHIKREVAVRIPYLDFIGNQSICVMEIEKI